MLSAAARYAVSVHIDDIADLRSLVCMKFVGLNGVI